MKPIEMNTQKKMHKLLDRFIIDFNTFEGIQEWTENALGKYWEDAVVELAYEGNYGWAMAYKLAIRKMLSDLGMSEDI